MAVYLLSDNEHCKKVFLLSGCDNQAQFLLKAKLITVDGIVFCVC